MYENLLSKNQTLVKINIEFLICNAQTMENVVKRVLLGRPTTFDKSKDSICLAARQVCCFLLCEI